MAGIKGQKMPNRCIKNPRTRAKTECKCLTRANPSREKYEDLTMLICGGEACYMKCKECTVRPHGCGYVAITDEAVMVR